MVQELAHEGGARGMGGVVRVVHIEGRIHDQRDGWASCVIPIDYPWRP